MRSSTSPAPSAPGMLYYVYMNLTRPFVVFCVLCLAAAVAFGIWYEAQGAVAAVQNNAATVILATPYESYEVRTVTDTNTNKERAAFISEIRAEIQTQDTHETTEDVVVEEAILTNESVTMQAQGEMATPAL